MPQPLIMIAFIEKIARFGITGAIGMCIDFSITWLCKEKLKWNKFYANATGFMLAVCNNYLVNRAWTFHSRDPHMARQFVVFLLVSLAGLLINTGVIYLLHEKMKKKFYFSKIIATGVVMGWNFGLNSLVTFRDGS